MAATPKNPLDGGGAIQGSPNMTIAPKVPAYDGGQFARDSMTPEEIGVSRDREWNEIPADRTSHANATPEHSNPLYTGRQFDTQVKMPTGMQYGVSVDAGGVSKEATSISVHKADRGPEN